MGVATARGGIGGGATGRWAAAGIPGGRGLLSAVGLFILSVDICNVFVGSCCADDVGSGGGTGGRLRGFDSVI
ncbi:hypothetical protein DSM107003_31510 [Trichormus variabilis SAG 1403-4b]|uniref:Uncharacterized protein n=1 Tax=Trichormus variabilis SAG 1403-4b TaxID=447716 RepID=A0A3S1A8D9_ANAVA|nr:hypothetical protein DSM107003_31510 [Trichormus variabilis SAG 1403-4b]